MHEKWKIFHIVVAHGNSFSSPLFNGKQKGRKNQAAVFEPKPIYLCNNISWNSFVCKNHNMFAERMHVHVEINWCVHVHSKTIFCLWFLPLGWQIVWHSTFQDLAFYWKMDGKLVLALFYNIFNTYKWLHDMHSHGKSNEWNSYRNMHVWMVKIQRRNIF